jgi:hypothetical protein
VRGISDPVRDGRWSFLAGDYDGVVGWLVALMAVVALVVAAAVVKKRPPS